MPNQVKDKQRLLNKIFVSATFTQQIDPPLIVSPHFISLILSQAQNTPKQYQIALINQILDFFVNRQTSSLILYTFDDSSTDVEHCILDSLIMWMLKTINNKQQAIQYLKKIPSLLSFYHITLKNISKLTQYLSIAFYDQSFNTTKMFFIISLLKIYVHSKKGVLNSPRHFFFIYGGPNNSNIKTVPHINQQNQISIKNSFFISLVFKHSMKQSFNQHNIFYFSTQKKQKIICHLDQNYLFIGFKYQQQKKYKMYKVQQVIRFNKWYRLSIQFTHHQTSVKINDNQYKIKPLISKQKQRILKQCTFGQNFYGMMSSMFMANRIPLRQQYTFQQFPFGIQSWDSITKLKKYPDFFKSIIFSCLPFSVFQVRYQMHCFDLFNRKHSTIGQNIALWKNYTVANGTEVLGGLNTILPLFYLARFFNHSDYPQLIQDILQVFIIMIEEGPLQLVEQQVIKQNIFIILGQHLMQCQNFINKNVLRLLRQIDSFFRLEQNKKDCFKYLLWGISFNKVYQKSLVDEHFQYIFKNYSIPSNNQSQQQALKNKNLLNNKKYQQTYSFINVIYYMIKNLQDSGRNCCLNHYANQCILSDEFNLSEAYKLKTHNHLTHYKWIQKIASTILENQLILLYFSNSLNTSNSNQNNNALNKNNLNFNNSSAKKLINIGYNLYNSAMDNNKSQSKSQSNTKSFQSQTKLLTKVVFQIKSILRLLMHKYSTCLYLVVLRIIKNQVKLFYNTKFLSILSSKVNILMFLTYLSQKTIDCQIIADIIFLLLATYQGAQPNSSYRKQIVKFIKSLIKRLDDFPKNKVNPALKAAKKGRKYSFQLQLLQYHQKQKQTKESFSKQFKSQLKNKDDYGINSKGYQEDIQSLNYEIEKQDPVKFLSIYESNQIIQERPIDKISPLWKQLHDIIPQNVRSWNKLYFILRNFMMGILSQCQNFQSQKVNYEETFIQTNNEQKNKVQHHYINFPQRNQWKIQNEDSLQLIFEYFKICDDHIKELILKDLLQSLMLNISNLKLYKQSINLNNLLIEAIGQNVNRTSVIGQMSIKIISTIFQNQIRLNQNINQYYIFLKVLLNSRKQFFIDLFSSVFKDLLSRRVINKQNLNSLLLIIEYQTLESKIKFASLTQLSVMVLQQIIDEISKHYYKYISGQFKENVKKQHQKNLSKKDKEQDHNIIQKQYSNKNNSERQSQNKQYQDQIQMNNIQYLLILMVNRNAIKVPFFSMQVNTGILQQQITFNFDNVLSKLQIDPKMAMLDISKMGKRYYLFEVFIESMSRVIWDIITQCIQKQNDGRKQSVEIVSVNQTQFDEQIKKRANSAIYESINSLQQQIIIQEQQSQLKISSNEDVMMKKKHKINQQQKEQWSQAGLDHYSNNFIDTKSSFKSKIILKKTNFSKGKNSYKNIYNIDTALRLLQKLAQMTIFYINIKMCSQILDQNQNARMFLILVSNLLLQLSQNNSGIFQIKQIGQQAQILFIKIWSYIMKILVHYSKDQSVKNMDMLYNRITQFQLNPILVEMFQYFIKIAYSTQNLNQKQSIKIQNKQKQTESQENQDKKQDEKDQQIKRQKQTDKQDQLNRKVSNSSIELIKLVQLIKINDLRQFQKDESRLLQFIKSSEFHQALMMQGKVVQVLLQCFYKNTRYLKDSFVKKISKEQDKFNKKNSFDQIYQINQKQQKIKIQCGKTKLSKQKAQKIVKSQQKFRKAQQLFDQQNTAEQYTRLRFLHQQDKKLRKFHSNWRNLWNNLRIYHKPYGFWMAQKDQSNQYNFSKLKHKNFKFMISKYNTLSGMSPVLQAEIVQPWHIAKAQCKQKHKYLTSFTEMMRQSLMNQGQRKQNSIDLGAQMLKSVWKNILKPSNIVKSLTQQNKFKQYDCKWIQGSLKAKGRVVIRDQQLIFYYDGVQQQDSHLSFQRFILPIHKQTSQFWRLATILKVNKRRYLLKYTAIQLLLNTTQKILLNFNSNDLQNFINDLQKVRDKIIYSYESKIKSNKISFYQNSWYKDIGIDQNITQDWVNRKISNLQYLIQVNNAACRGIYDLSQYLVVPWVVEMNNDKQPIVRDLTKTLGALGSEQRKKIIIQKYKSRDPFNPVPAFYYGTHYSSPGVVFNFLIRLSPFTQYCKRLQGGKFDIADRLFSSFINSWKSAMTEVSDVRQLVPQFYYLPQTMLNIQNHNLGVTQCGQIVRNIEMPPWAANNPYFFVIQMRQIMESQKVSQTINKWIDLIFGYKQRGKQAEQALNVYYYLTYEQHLKLMQSQQDQIHRKSCQAQIVHFGQIPPQIFQKPHPQRNPSKSCLLQIGFIFKFKLTNQFQQKVVGLWLSDNNLDMKIIKRNAIDTLSVNRYPPVLQKSIKFNLQKSRDDGYYLLKKQRSASVIFKNHFLVYGYMNNQFRIFNRSSGLIQDYDTIESTITYIYVNEDNDLIFVGSHTGILHVYEIQYEGSSLIIRKMHAQHFSSSIVHISQRDGFYAVSFGNYVALYKFARSLFYIQTKQGQNNAKLFIKFFRSFRCSLPVKFAFILKCPLYGIVICDNANIRAYSINGQFLKSITANGKHIGVIQDGELNDVIYYIQDEKIVLISSPDLRNLSQMEIKDYLQIYGKFVIFKDQVAVIGLQNKLHELEKSEKK